MPRRQKCSWEGCERRVVVKDIVYRNDPRGGVVRNDGLCGPHLYLNALFCGWPDQKVVVNVDEYLYWRRLFSDDEFFHWVNAGDMWIEIITKWRS